MSISPPPSVGEGGVVVVGGSGVVYGVKSVEGVKGLTERRRSNLSSARSCPELAPAPGALDRPPPF